MYTAPKLLFSKGTAGEQPFTDPRLMDQKTINNGQQATPSGMVPPTKLTQLNPLQMMLQLKRKFSMLLNPIIKISIKLFGKMV